MKLLASLLLATAAMACTSSVSAQAWPAKPIRLLVPLAAGSTADIVSRTVAAELGKQLGRRGHSVHFVSYRLPFRLDDFHENIRYHEVDLTSYSLFEYPPHDLALAAKMAEVGREQKLDLFHVHYAIPHAITGLLAQQMLGDNPPKLITTLHGTDITLVGQDRTFFEITKFGIMKSQGVTAVSEFLKRMTVEVFKVGEDIEVIPNFVDLSV